MRETAGEVYVNGAHLNSAWTTGYWQAQGCWDTTSDLPNLAASARGGVQADAAEIGVPMGHSFMMGDNRTARGSQDFRSFGVIPLRDVAGRAAGVIWPVLRSENVGFDCTGLKVRGFSGAEVRHLRVLDRPPGFTGVPAPR